MNNHGHVVGNSTIYNAFLWRDGTMLDVGNPGGFPTGLWGINDVGQVVGALWTSGEGRTRPFLWQQGSIIDLGILGRFDEGAAIAINEAGQVVGNLLRRFDGHRYGGFIWKDGVMSDLGTLGGENNMGAMDINDAGQVVGKSQVASGDYHAFLWQNGQMTDLGTLGGEYSAAYAINNLGQVVGLSGSAYGGQQAILWDSGGIINLGELFDPGLGVVYSEASGINDAGEVIGIAYYIAGYDEWWGYEVWAGLPFLWSANMGMALLHNLIPFDYDLQGGFLRPVAINGAGEIAAVHIYNDNQSERALVLKPLR